MLILAILPQNRCGRTPARQAIVPGLALVACLVLFLAGAATGAETVGAGRSLLAAQTHLAAGDRYAAEGKSFLAANQYRLAIARGLDQADVHWKLSLALYGLGLVDEAITAISRARELSPEADYFHLPAGILHLAKGDLERAAAEFVAALEINPAFADAYYYLGEVDYRRGDYRRAWLCNAMAKALGHAGDGLRQKLAATGVAPGPVPWQASPERLHLRQIVAASREEAEELLQRIAAGELFEYLAGERGPELSQGTGGYVGEVARADLDAAVAEALFAREILAPPIIVETSEGFQLLQRVAPFDPGSWELLLGRAPLASAPGPAAVAGAAQVADPVLPQFTSPMPAPLQPLREILPEPGPPPAPVGAFVPPGEAVVAATAPPDPPLAAAVPEKAAGAGATAGTAESRGESVAASPSATADGEGAVTMSLLEESAPVAAVAPVLPEGVYLDPAAAFWQPEAANLEPPGALAFLILAGVYDDENAALALSARLAAQGFAAFLERRQTSAGTFFEVYAGRYPGREEAVQTAARLERLGIDCVISERRLPVVEALPDPVDTSPDDPDAAATGFVLHAGAFSSEINARKRLERLTLNGFPAYLFPGETAAGHAIHVVAGKYASRQEALAAAARLKALGIDHFISVTR